MPDTDNESLEAIARQNQDVANTMQAYISKLPLLKDGANTGGTLAYVSGTGPAVGTIAGTYTINGTWSYRPADKWVYVLGTLVHNETQSGTFGTLVLNNIRLNGESLGTLGANIVFPTVYGDYLTLYSSVDYEYKINVAGTGYVGTWKIDNEVTGWKFRSEE